MKHYFNGLHPSKQMFVLNYDHRKKEDVKTIGFEESKDESIVEPIVEPLVDATMNDVVVADEIVA